MNDDFEITVAELKQRLDRGDDLILLDVREPIEYQICRLEGATLLPMSQLQTRVGELDDEREMIVYCHHGVRSARVVSWLRSQGFEKTKSLAGGIDAWSLNIDPRVARY